jgi:hypothetical protein
MKDRVVRLLVSAGAASIPLLIATPALAYVVGSGSSGSAPAVVGGGVSFTFTATFLQPSAAAPTAVALSEPSGTRVTDSLSRSAFQVGPAVAAASGQVAASGAPVPAGVTVTFAKVSGPGQPTFNPLTTTTNSAGQASSIVTLPSGYPGQYVLAATLAGGGSVTLTVVEAGGFPNTVADAMRQPAAALWPFAAGSAALLLIAVAFGLGLRRSRQAR